MMIENRWMSLWRVGLVLAVLASACTKPNPQSCQDGTCTDPAFPFCDLDGALAGEEQTCIAVACTANEFVACRGDRAITCNTTGTDYELELCGGGCDEAANGCRLCEPNQTLCANGKVQTCDANGAVVASETCALGCFEDQPRCRQVDPSNNLGAYLDMVPSPTDLDLSDAIVTTATGAVEKNGMTVQGLTSFLVTAPTGGASIRVFVARDVRLSNVTIRGHEQMFGPRNGPGFAIVATGDIRVEGRVVVPDGAGEVTLSSCLGGASYLDLDIQDLITGHGGGGHATTGAKGGDITNRYDGGPGGAISGTETLVPLRGGCASGSHTPGQPGAYGGGAIQLSSQKSIVISDVVDVRGALGGGAGGGLLIEAPKVALGPGGKLIATGGGGGVGSTRDETLAVTIPVRLDDGQPERGASTNYIYISGGGNGAAPGVPATAGINAPYSSSPSEIGAGSGGGGLGRIRINTRDQLYTKANTSLEAGALTTGIVPTR